MYHSTVYFEENNCTENKKKKIRNVFISEKYYIKKKTDIKGIINIIFWILPCSYSCTIGRPVFYAIFDPNNVIMNENVIILLLPMDDIL